MGEDIVIRKAGLEDIPTIMKFINEHWKQGHILARSQVFFYYQHVWKQEVCFVIAEDNNTNELEGILGYIPYGDGEGRDLFGAIWKVKSSKYPMLGMKLQLYAVKQLDSHSISAISLNHDTLTMHKRWGAFLGKLRQHYILGDLNGFEIADIKRVIVKECDRCIKQLPLKMINEIHEINNICEVEKKIGKVPLKSLEFIQHRYFAHPIYEYEKYGIFDDGILVGVMVAREIHCNARKILRIIDFLGDISYIGNIGLALKALLKEKKYEYLDLYEYGIKQEFLDKAGFVLREENDENIIPNYFEPYVKRNIDIDFYTSNNHEKLLLFKGDGDQDRPN